MSPYGQVRATIRTLTGRVPFPTFSLLLLILLASDGLDVIQATASALSPEYASATRIWRFPKTVLPAYALSPSASGASSSPDVGWDFTANTRIHPEEGGQHIWPDIAVGPDSRVAVAWMDDHAPGGYHIFYSYSNDGGMTWSVPEQVDSRVAGGYSKFVDMEFTPLGVPVLVWEDDRLGQINTYLSKRVPGGWTPEVRVNTAGSPPSGADFMNPSLAVLDDERYFVAWTDWRGGVFHQVYGRSTTDGGATWGRETQISDGLGYEPVAGDPCLIVDPTSGSPPGTEILYCVTNDWRGNVPGGRFPNVYFYRSTDGGASWTIGVQVNDIEPYFQQVSSHALVRLIDGTLTAGWLNGDFASSHFRTSVSTDQGVSWGASAQVDVAGTGTYSSIVSFDNWVFAAFQVYEGNWNAYFRASSDGGRSWVEEVCRMDDDTGGNTVANPVIAALSPVKVHAAWSDNRPGGAWKVYASQGDRRQAAIAEGDRGGGAPHVTLLSSPNPCPLGRALRIQVGTPSSAAGGAPGSELWIHDLSGRVVTRLRLVAGEATWNGTDERGRLVGPGVYWASLRSATRAETETRAAVVLVP